MSHRSIALDCHTHLAPVVPELLRGLPGIAWHPDDSRLVLDGTVTLASPSVFRPEALLAWMDAQGVRCAWYSVPPPMYRDGLDAEAAATWCAYVNRALQIIGEPHGGRISPTFLLPVRHPSLAARIVAECGPQGARFAMAAGHAASGVMLSDAAYDPLWAALNASGACVLLHPTAGSDTRLNAFFLHNLLGGPGETALAAAHLALGRVIERFPRIRFILSHGGGSTALVAGRIARGQAVRRPGADTGAPPMTTALRHFFVDCITHSGPALALVERAFGPDRILFGSDWPFSMGLTDPWAQLADVAPDTLERLRIATVEAGGTNPSDATGTISGR
ncbi:amidohydrolase [Roseomonas sp. HJA6]|uniref:Amidohydrolase n=1 Tax=Roseomonas alba TaxID=2846776 RepID=A0ABS7AJL1_9PROT|nr:amidohydrolase family protein [Neoroseomonas alba]MBW6401540.1 amidohydrolase [Neoroseomonas alba]